MYLQRIQDDRLTYCKTKILLRSKFSPAQTLHRRNTLKLVKPLRLPPVFQVQGSDLLCLVYMMNNLSIYAFVKLRVRQAGATRGPAAHSFRLKDNI